MMEPIAVPTLSRRAFLASSACALAGAPLAHDRSVSNSHHEELTLAAAGDAGERSGDTQGGSASSNETVLYTDAFTALDNWHHEGGGAVTIPTPGTMRIECIGSRQGGEGCMMFCREDFPDGIAVEYGLRVLNSNGLVITFVAARGLNGEDMITGLPPRQGVFADYVGEDAKLRSYHVSVCRYDDKGVHTGVSNWRRNPGLNLMAQGEDLCKEVARRYAVRIEKDGPRCALFVDGRPGPAFVDPGTLPGQIPTEGKVGFRAIGSNVVAEVDGFTVKKLGG